MAPEVSQAECGLRLVKGCSEKLAGQPSHADPRVSAKPESEPLTPEDAVDTYLSKLP